MQKKPKRSCFWLVRKKVCCTCKGFFFFFFWLIRSAYHLYGKAGNSGENSNGTVHSGQKVMPFEVFPFFPFLPKQPKFSVPFVWIASGRLQVERKRKSYLYFVNGTTQSRSCFRYQKKYQYYLTEVFHQNFRTNGERS